MSSSGRLPLLTVQQEHRRLVPSVRFELERGEGAEHI